MKNSILIICICVSGIFNYIYSQNSIFGTFSYTFNGKITFLELRSDNTFFYCYGCSYKNTWGDGNTWGYWEVKDSFLILNSTMPERITVYEDYNKKSKFSVINIFPSNFPNDIYLRYNIYIITEKNDTLSFLKRTEHIIRVKGNIKSFWIEDNDTGIKSRQYFLLSKKSNIISVLFYKGIMFENENWLIVNKDKIRADGKLLIRTDKNK
ncbi:MAG: hypothetical protein H6Q20_1634 [Bacteroidetes bacterium]|nr:hypothetical protein [Bacteroidota bacterium]